MKLIWLSVAPWSPSGYGLVTRQIVPRIQNEGHEVTVATKHFHTGTVEWNGIKTIQGTDLDMLDRMVDRGEADYIISLLDNHSMDGHPKKWISYTPFDTQKIPKSISQTLEHAHLIIALTRHGQKEIESLGYDCLYAPHGVDTEIYCPDDNKRKESRKLLGWEDNFIVGTVGINYADDRKNILNLMLAFKWFHDEHDEARMYLSVNPLHTDGNDTLTRCLSNLELENLVKWAPPDDYFMGRIGDEKMANRYRMMDVFCMPTKGEGFGLPLIEAQACGTPVITTGASTGPELCPTQFLIDVQPHEWEWFNKEWRPRVSAQSILDSIELAYHSDLRNIGEKGRIFTQKYDWDEVFSKYWIPILKEIENLKTKVYSIPDYRKLYERFDGRITMSDCAKWCDITCPAKGYLHAEKPTLDRTILERSYPVIADNEGKLWVDTKCPLHNWLSKKFKKEVKGIWTYLWGFPKIRQSLSKAPKDFIPLDEEKIGFNDEYKWAMQSHYRTNCPDISKYLKGRVLDIGCGDGERVKALRKKRVDAIGVEINPCQVDGYYVLHGDAEALPFRDESFDNVYSVDLLEHLSSPLRAISEAFRVSRDTVISSITPTESSAYWQDPTHKVEWDRERWKREINEYGDIIDIKEPFTIVARKR